MKRVIPISYYEELQRQSRVILIPACILAMTAWLPFIPLDRALFPDLGVFFYLRVGLSFVGFSAIVLRFSLLGRNRSYILLYAILCYLEMGTAGIVGLTGAHPVYMGGFAMNLLLLPLLPFKREHTLVLVAASLTVFLVCGIFSQMRIHTVEEAYCLLNLVCAVLATVITVFLLDYIRRKHFHKQIVIQQRNEQIEIQRQELEEALQKIKTLSGLLPICSSCKSIRDSEGYWHSLEAYIEEHSDAAFSHSLCEECLKKLYPKVYAKMKQNTPPPGREEQKNGKKETGIAS